MSQHPTDPAMRSPLEKCLVLLPPGMRWRWAGLIPLVVLTAAFEALGAAAVFALIKIVTDPSRVSTMPVASTVAAWLPARDERTVVLGCTALLALFYVAKNLFLTVTEYTRSRCVGDGIAALSATLLSGYLRVPYAFHLRRNSADLIRNADEAVRRVFSTVMAPALSIITEALVVGGIVVVLLAAAPLVTLTAGGVLLGLSVVFLKVTRRGAERLGTQLDGLSKTVLRHLQEALGGIKEIKVLGREGFFSKGFAEGQNSLARIRRRHAILAALPRITVETLFVCGALFVIMLVTLRGATGPDTMSLLGLYAYAGFRVIPSANRILWQLNEVRYGSAAIDQVYQDFLAVTRSGAPAPADAETNAFGFRDRLVLDGVSYRYAAAERPALRDVSLTIRRGESIGIVGPTGAGKSTLVDLVVGLLEPSSGRITVDGVELRERMSGWQRRIGYVPQAIFLIDASLRRNIALGIPDHAIDEGRVHTAVRTAQLDEFIASLPDGLDTVVGERGVRLSGGERQRVGIARALYHEPQVLIFDEATAALDGRTEAELTRAIESLRGRTTLVLIAHRLSSVRQCDRLVFVQDGRVAGCGSFDELMERNADFRRLATAADEATA